MIASLVAFDREDPSLADTPPLEAQPANAMVKHPRNVANAPCAIARRMAFDRVRSGRGR
jgi:hypothetical protein